MPTFASHPVSTRVKALICGDSKSGKTGVLATLANAGFKVHILDIDRGIDILADKLTADAVKNVDYVQLNNKDKSAWKESHEHIFKSWDGGKDNVYTWGPDDVFVIDSATFHCDACHTDVLLGAGVAVDAAKYDRGYWQVTAKRYEGLVSMLTDDAKVKCNVVMTAHLRNIENEQGISKTYPSFLGQQLPNIIPRYMNNMWRVDVKPDGKRVFRTQSDSRMSLGSSMPSLLKAEEEFDLGKLFTKMRDAAKAKQEGV